LLVIIVIPTPKTTLFPYTTLFRSSNGNEEIEILEKDLLELPRNIPQEDYTFPMLISVIKDPDDKISDPHLYIKSATAGSAISYRSEEHTSELHSRENLVCRLLLE